MRWAALLFALFSQYVLGETRDMLISEMAEIDQKTFDNIVKLTT